MTTTEIIALTFGFIVTWLAFLSLVLWLVAEEKIRKDREKFGHPLIQKRKEQEDGNA